MTESEKEEARKLGRELVMKLQPRGPFIATAALAEALAIFLAHTPDPERDERLRRFVRLTMALVPLAQQDMVRALRMQHGMR